MVKEIVLAIDPALHKIEEILLWKNKFKTIGVFTLIHFVFWLFMLFNLRTYCLISFVFLFLHLLDGYRTKKRREIIRSKQILVENISSLGRYIIYIYAKLVQLWTKLKKIKQKNRLKYFLIMFLSWSMTTVIGVKIRGIYLAYFLFWIVFFVPAILHYDILKKLLRKALPLLEQLDHSMKYERRSILDKSDLLVDVKLPQSEINDEEEEDQYLESFRLDESQRREFERFGDNENDEDSESVDEYVQQKDIEVEIQEDEDSYGNKRITTRKTTIIDKDNNAKKYKQLNMYNTDTDEDESMLPDDTLPNMSEILDDTFQNDDGDKYLYKNIESGDRVVGRRNKISAKSRPSVLNYYENYFSNNKDDEEEDNDSVDHESIGNKMNRSMNAYYSSKNDNEKSKIMFTSISNNKLPSAKNSISKKSNYHQHNDQDIDETFDFLDEELNKY